MLRIGSREFKNRLGRYLQAVRNGQTLIITDRKRPVAKVSPPDAQQVDDQAIETRLRELEAQGLLCLAKRPLSKFEAIPSRGKSASRMIIEDRG